MSEPEPFPPAGTVALMLLDKSLQRLGMKTGENIDDVVPWIELPKEIVVKDIEENAVASDFNEKADLIFKHKGDTILLGICNIPDQFEFNYLWYQSAKAIAKFKEEIEAKAAREAPLAAPTSLEGGAAVDVGGLPTVAEPLVDVQPYVPRIFSPRPWENPKTQNGAETETSILSERMTNSRHPLSGFYMSQPRFRFSKKSETFQDRNPFEKIDESKRWDDPITHPIELSVLEAGFQASPAQNSVATQTALWGTKVNKITKYAPQTLTEQEKQDIMASKEMAKFITKAYDSFRPALQMNETIDIFREEFKMFDEEEVSVGNRAENSLVSMHGFGNKDWTSKKTVSSINWHPTRQGLVTFAATHNLSFDQWADSSGTVLASAIFVWHFIDPLKPQLQLEVPGDLTCFKINPNNENIVIGGLLTGQVLFWDLSEAYSMLDANKVGKMSAKDTKQKQQEAKTEKEEEAAAKLDGEAAVAGAEEAATASKLLVPPVKPVVISYVDKSHSRAVSDIGWLSPKLRVEGKKGHVTKYPNNVVSSQFVTVSTDGLLFVWDCDVNRMQNMSHQVPENRRSTNPRSETRTELRWVPLFTVSLIDPTTSQFLPATCLSLSPEGTSLQAGTEDGELLFADFAAHAKPGTDAHAVEAGEKKDNHVVSSVLKGHFQHVYGVQVSPHFPNIIMTVADWSFIIWKAGMQEPVFKSAASPDYVTCARWSPTRPAVIMVGRANGTIDVWDLLDQCHKPAQSHSCGEGSIFSMEFWTNPTQTVQYLAVGDVGGDKGGKCHVIDIPRNLRRAIQTPLPEKELMENFYAREISRVNYLKQREHDVHDEARKIFLAAEVSSAADMQTPEERREKALQEAEQSRKAASEEEAKDEAAFQAMLKKFRLHLDSAKEHEKSST